MAQGFTHPLTEMNTRNFPRRGRGGGDKSGRQIRLTASQPFVSRWSRKCEILVVPQYYGPSPHITGITLLFKTVFTVVGFVF
jgi:hypothetical protein